MYKKSILCIIVCLLAIMPASAQYSKNRVALLDMDATTSVFYAEGFGKDRNDALENARKATLYKIMYEGVEDFNNNTPVVASSDYQRTNIWLRDFFTGDGKNSAPYKAFLGDVELVGDYMKNAANEYSCIANVVIKHEMLFRQAGSQGVMQQSKTPVQKVTPTEQDVKENEVVPQAQPEKKKKGFL